MYISNLISTFKSNKRGGYRKMRKGEPSWRCTFIRIIAGFLTVVTLYFAVIGAWQCYKRGPFFPFFEKKWEKVFKKPAIIIIKRSPVIKHRPK